MPTGDQADINVNLSINTIMFMKDVRQIGYALEHMAGAFRSIGFAMSAAVTAPLVGIGTAAVAAAGKMETFSVAFTQLLQSSEKAEAQMEWMKDFAKRTPFRFEDVAKATQQFMAYGFSVEEANQMMVKLTDVTAAFGGSAAMIDAVTKAIGQMHGRQRVTAQEMTQLTEAGINAWEGLAKELNVSVAEAMDKVTKKEVDAATGIRAVMNLASDPKYAGAAARQMETLNGAISNLQDSIQFLLADLGESFLPMIKTVINDYLLPLIDKISDLGKQFSDLPMNVQLAALALAGLAAAIGPLFLALTPVLQITGGIMSAMSPLITAAMYGVGRSMPGVAGGAAAAAAKGVPFIAAGELAEGLGPGAAMALLEGGGLGMAAIGTTGVGGGAVGGTAAGGGILATLAGLAPYVAVIAAITAALVALAAVFKSAYDQSEPLRNSVKTFGDHLERLGGVILNTVYPGVKDTSSLMEKMWKIVEDARKAFDAFGLSCADTFRVAFGEGSNFIDYLIENLPSIVKTIKDIGTGINNFFVGALLYAYNILKPLIDAVIQFGVGLINMLIPALTSLYNGVMPLLLDVLGDLWDLLEIIWKTIEKNILPYVRAAIDILVAFVTLLVQLVGPVVIGVVDQIIDTFKFLVKTILNVLGLVVDFLTGDFSGAMDHLKGILTDSIDFLGDTVNNIFNTVYTIATTIGNAIRDFFANIYNSIRSNFLNPLIDVANALDRKFNGGKNQMDYFGKMMTTSEEAQYNKEQMQATWSDAYGGGVAAGAAAAATVFTNAYSGVGATIKTEYGNAYSKPGGGLIYAGGRAIGGPVSSGLPYMVGERGPELFVPNSNGYIAPNVASGRPITVVLEVDGRQVAKATAPYTSDYVRMRQGVRKGVR